MSLRDNLKNGFILGAITGVLMVTPKISLFISDFIADILPSSWQFLGSFSIPFYGLLIGGLTGYLIDKY